MTEVLASSTIFSLGAEPPARLPATGEAEQGALETAFLAGENDRIGVAIRKLSAAGATLLISHALQPGERWTLELGNGQSFDGLIAWSTNDEAGLAFDAPVDVVGTLARNLAALPAERRQVPRVELHHTIGIRSDDSFQLARTRDLSQAGVGIDTALRLQPDDRVHVALDGLPALDGVVRWAQSGHAGIAFDQEIPWQTLMPWLRQAQTSPIRPTIGARPSDEAPHFGLGSDKQVIRLHSAARVREGSRWWNVRVRHISSLLTEFECMTPLAKGAQLWLWLPGFAGWPMTITEADSPYYLAEFRMPMRQRDMQLLSPGRLSAG